MCHITNRHFFKYLQNYCIVYRFIQRFLFQNVGWYVKIILGMQCQQLGVKGNCNYILFTKLPWPGGTFRSLSQAATCPPVYHTRQGLHTVPFNAECQAGKLWIPIFIVFGLTQLGIEPESTASVADTLSTRPLIGCDDPYCIIRFNAGHIASLNIRALYND